MTKMLVIVTADGRFQNSFTKKYISKAVALTALLKAQDKLMQLKAKS